MLPSIPILPFLFKAYSATRDIETGLLVFPRLQVFLPLAVWVMLRIAEKLFSRSLYTVSNRSLMSLFVINYWELH